MMARGNGVRQMLARFARHSSREEREKQVRATEYVGHQILAARSSLQESVRQIMAMGRVGHQMLTQLAG